MRYSFPFAVALIAAIFPAAGAGQSPFSHQLHLNKVGATCTACHVGATTSTEATDSNLPPASVCLNCHDGETAKMIDTGFLEDRQSPQRT
jgi:c(7)-type cytochrome triheme protein